MWWWFKKREHKHVDDKKWASLAASLKLSFSQVREDVNHLTTSDSIHHEQIEHLTYRINKLESRIDSLLLALHINQPPAQFMQERAIQPPQITQEFNPEPTLHLIEHLTEVQRNILFTLTQLSKELPSEWISLKELAIELYPNKRYNDVRTMMSEYTDRLLDFGLINKKRKGREVLVALTEKTKQLQAHNQPRPLQKEQTQKKEEPKNE